MTPAVRTPFSPTSYYADHAWLGGDEVAPAVLIEVEGERITALRTGVERPADAIHLVGLTLPGLANAHSHAFHRALRGRTHAFGGTFWTWREEMYAVAAALTPESYYQLARATYAEMVLAGVSCVGEFHYLHHAPGGSPYADPNELGYVLISAAQDAGCYKLIATSRTSRPNVHELYERLGFEKHGVEFRMNLTG